MSLTRSGELTAEDLTDLLTSLAAGRRRTLWLREPLTSLGLLAGASARVVSVEGTTVTVRPKGVADDVPFEARELAGSRAAAIATPLRTARPPRVRTHLAPVLATATATAPVPATAPVTAPVPVLESGSAVPAAAPAPKSAARRGSRLSRNPSLTVVLRGSTDGGWVVEHAVGDRPPSRPAAVSAEAVARAVQCLGHPGTSEAVEAVLERARAAAHVQVAELSAQLERARVELAALGG